MQHVRKIFVLIVVVCALISAGVVLVRLIAKKEPALCDSCNVLIVSVEALGYRHTSLAGELTTTPALTSFANKAVSFDRAYAQSPWTIPSHAAMFTGVYPWKLNIWNGVDGLPNTPTLATKLTNAGYTTALFSNGFIHKTFGFDQGFEHTYGTLTATTASDDQDVFSSALAWIKGRSDNTPFFVVVHPAGVYLPYGSVSGETIARMHQKPEGPTDSDQYLVRTQHEQEIRSLDAALGVFLEEVARSVDVTKTIIIVVSANGERLEASAELGLHAASLSEEVLHVPFVLSVPNTPPSRITATVETRSIFPTVLDLVGVSTQPESLVPLVRGVNTSDRIVVAATAKTPEQAVEGLTQTDQFISALDEKPRVIRSNPVYAGSFSITSIKGSWKAVRTPNMKTVVFNVSEDPLEQIDRSNTLTDDALKAVGTLLLSLRI